MRFTNTKLSNVYSIHIGQIQQYMFIFTANVIICAHSSTGVSQMSVRTGVSCSALASEDVDELYTVVGSNGVTGVRQALIDIAFTALTYKTRQTHATITAYTVHAAAAVKAPRLAG